MHLAGIIPVANLQTDFESSIPACMFPVANGFAAIQKAVFECAIAGCQTIWVVANDDMAPIIRQTVGEWTYDPVYYSRPYEKYPQEARKEIPIYYVPIHPKDRDRRDSYGWGVLYGISCVWRVANVISRWLVPEKYFVSFPMSVYNIYRLRQLRSLISDGEKNFFLSHEGDTVKHNEPLAFTLFGHDFVQCRRQVNTETSREFKRPAPGEQYPSERLPLSERWSARYFDFETVFQKVTDDNAHVHALEWYYDLSTWSEYCRFLGSDNFIKRPAISLTRAHRHVTIPYVGGNINEDA